MSSPAQITANQRNAALSTGPTSDAGKATSSLNAVKTGLTGRTILLPSDDAALYEAHLDQFLADYEPASHQECTLVQSIADTHWRLARIPSLEMGIYALGRIEFTALFANEDESTRKHLIEAKTLLTYHRQLTNLSIQEGRLRRQREKDTTPLLELQEERKRQAQAAQEAENRARVDQAARLYIEAIDNGGQYEFEPSEIGFEFSLELIERRAMELDPTLFANDDEELEAEAA